MEVLGIVESLWRYPVKSMKGEELLEAFAGFAGVYGDRLYAFHSSSAPDAFPYLTAREQGRMLLYRPVYRYAESMARPPHLCETEAMGPSLRPLHADPSQLTLDIETPAGELLPMEDPRLISALRESIGDANKHQLTLLRSERALTDCRPVSLFSLQTVKQLSQELNVDMDKRRFRANIYVDLKSGNGFGEDAFVGHSLRIGARAKIRVLERDPRCKMITLDPATGHAEPEIMRGLTRAHDGKAGVYAAILVEGTIRPGDEITLLD